MKGKKTIIGILVIGICLFIGYSAISSFVDPYKHVCNLKSDPERYMREEVQVAALIVNGTFEKVGPNSYRFAITDGEETIAVEYEGILPGAFRQDAGVVLIGKLKDENTFEAKKMLSQCPSKYKEKVEERMEEK
ncbi:MAG: cytochrome c maturation protein CcmE [Candidatus Syntropharchaeia archaeon]